MGSSSSRYPQNHPDPNIQFVIPSSVTLTSQQRQILRSNNHHQGVPFKPEENSNPRNSRQETFIFRNVLHLHKKSLQLFQTSNDKFQLQFKFDTKQKCLIRIYHLAGILMEPPFSIFSLPDSWETEFEHNNIGLNQTFLSPNEFSIDFQVMRNHGFVFQMPTEIDDRFFQNNTSHAFIIVLEGESQCESHETNIQITIGDFFTGPDGKTILKTVAQFIKLKNQIFNIQEIFGLVGRKNTSIHANNENLSEQQQENQNYTNEGEMGQNDQLCVVCLTNIKEIALLPCRHLCICDECSSLLFRSGNKCPICRTVVASFLHFPGSFKEFSVPNDQQEN